MSISAEDIKRLREMTSCGVIECKKALEESKGDFEKAKEVLKKRGLEIAAKKGGRVAKEGRIEAYVHPGNKVVAMVELNSETDFVAKNEAFIQLAKDLAMQIAAFQPKYIKREDVPEAELKEGEEYIKQVCLMEQAFIKDNSKIVRDCITNLIGSVGENIFVSRFTRYKVGE